MIIVYHVMRDISTQAERGCVTPILESCGLRQIGNSVPLVTSRTAAATPLRQGLNSPSKLAEILLPIRIFGKHVDVGGK